MPQLLERNVMLGLAVLRSDPNTNKHPDDDARGEGAESQTLFVHSGHDAPPKFKLIARVETKQCIKLARGGNALISPAYWTTIRQLPAENEKGQQIVALSRVPQCRFARSSPAIRVEPAEPDTIRSAFQMSRPV